jgi:hypothetical protein
LVNNVLYVPVRTTSDGVLTLRTGRLESGERIGLAFTSLESLEYTLGSAQQWINLGDESLRDMLAPLGIRQLRVDPLPLGQPGAGEVPRQARRRPVPHRYTPVTSAHMAAWTMAFRSLSDRTLSGHQWQGHSPVSAKRLAAEGLAAKGLAAEGLAAEGHRKNMN